MYRPGELCLLDCGVHRSGEPLLLDVSRPGELCRLDRGVYRSRELGLLDRGVYRGDVDSC